MTIDGWFDRAAASDPDRPAVIFGDTVLSYGAMAGRVAARAAELTRAGVGHGDRIAWYGLNDPEVFVLLFACARIGAILVPLNWRLAEAEIAGIVDNCAPKLIVHDAHFADKAGALRGAPAVLAGKPIAPGPTGPMPPAGPEARIEDPLLIIYTSGSTGRPKGAVLSQAAVACNAAMSVEAHDMTPRDTVLNALPLFHVGGLNILPTPAFSIGATVLLHRRFDPDAMCADLQRTTLAITVPTVLAAVLAARGWPDADLSRLRALSIGSTDVPVDLIEAVHGRGVPVIQIYGATETGPFAIYQRIGEAMSTVGSIGRAGSRCAIRLMRPDGTETGLAEPGEVWVKGANILSEYWRDPAQTATALHDGWFRTGDVAERDANGLYWFRDRIKHVIISGGENIYPAEIERALRRHPDVAEVAVVGRPDPKWGAVPVAVVAARRPLGADAVLAFLDGKLARYKRPRDVVFVKALPRNAMGKVVAADVRAMIGDGTAPVARSESASALGQGNPA